MVDAVYRVLQRRSALLRREPEQIFQLLFNSLAWEWPKSTILGAALREAAEFNSAPWLEVVRRLFPTEHPALRSFLPRQHLGAVDGEVRGLAFCGDACLLSRWEGGDSDLWDLRTGQLVRRFFRNGQEQTVNSFPETANGSLAKREETIRSALEELRSGQYMSGGASSEARRWQERIHSCLGITGTIRVPYFAEVSPDRAMLVIACGDAIHIWDHATGEPRSLIHCTEGTVTALAFSASSTLLATGHQTGFMETARESIMVWEVGGLQADGRSLPDGRWERVASQPTVRSLRVPSGAGTLISAQFGSGTL